MDNNNNNNNMEKKHLPSKDKLGRRPHPILDAPQPPSSTRLECLRTVSLSGTTVLLQLLLLLLLQLTTEHRDWHVNSAATCRRTTVRASQLTIDANAPLCSLFRRLIGTVF